MTELLERWARLEPERCGISEHAAHLGKSFAFRIHWAVLGADPINLAVVLAAVIEAIEERDAKAVKHNADDARGHDLHEWRYSLGGHSEETWAEVWSGLPMTVGRSYRAESESREPAAALLGAYLAALEAEAGQ